MEKKNNGKITIAILIMFVVALSIVGITYAYFTANIQQNRSEKSVTVKAGKLLATFNGTNSINVENIFPGWKSDGMTYFDASKMHTRELTATTASTKEELTTAIEAGVATAANGLVTPVQFTVSNISTAANADIDYVIKLVVTENTFARSVEPLDEDYKNLKVSLYRGTYNDNAESADDLPELDGTLIGTYYVPRPTGSQTTGELVLLTDAPENLAAGAAKSYFVVFEYEDDNTAQSSQYVDIKGNTIGKLSAKVEIIGVQKDSASGSETWYDEDNHEFDFDSLDTVDTDHSKTEANRYIYK